jgi:ADP-heptose:LPS heptosyltransferase
LFKASDLLITNDNGPMHIAAACGTKVIALFNKNLGGSNPFRWGPYGQGHTIFYKPIDEIKPSEIYEAAIKNLNR